MPDAQYGLITIGNAMVDVLAQTDDAYIARQDAQFGMKKGSMNLVEATRALTLYADMQKPTQMSGGSAGNTMDRPMHDINHPRWGAHNEHIFRGRDPINTRRY